MTFEFIDFSFYGDYDTMLALLSDADIFYMMGLGGRTIPPPFVRLLEPRSGLISKLVELVQYHNVLYFGICGSAILAGCHYSEDQRSLYTIVAGCFMESQIGDSHRKPVGLPSYTSHWESDWAFHF